MTVLRSNAVRRTIVALAAIAAVLWRSAPAPADSPELAVAIEEYEDADYAAARTALHALLYPRSQLRDRAEMIRARAFLAAVQLVFDERAAARAEIALILAVDRDFHFASTFDPELERITNELRATLPAVEHPLDGGPGADAAPEVDAASAPDAVPASSPDAGVAPIDLVLTAPKAGARVTGFRAISLVPFGVGQFAESRPVAGGLFAGSEIVLLGANLALGASLGSRMDDGRCDRAPSTCDGIQTAQNLAFAALVSVAVWGVLDAALERPNRGKAQ